MIQGSSPLKNLLHRFYGTSLNNLYDKGPIIVKSEFFFGRQNKLELNINKKTSLQYICNSNEVHLLSSGFLQIITYSFSGQQNNDYKTLPIVKINVYYIKKCNYSSIKYLSRKRVQFFKETGIDMGKEKKTAVRQKDMVQY